MLNIGTIQTLKILRIVEFGVYLGENEDAPMKEQVLLPKKEVPDGAQTGDSLSVFLYRDSEDRPIATTRTPELQLGEIRKLRCVAVSKIGAFLHWGLEKDLFLPYREQTTKVEKGGTYLVSLYLDKSSRLCATMRLYPLLTQVSDYKTGDQVTGTVYDSSEKFGLFVAVDDRYSARIPARENFGSVRVGDEIHARVTRVLEDGRLDLSLQEKSYLQMDVDAATIMKMLEEHGGTLGLSDKSDPELIKAKLHMSKAAFKRAVGRLLKQGKITITETDIHAV